MEMIVLGALMVNLTSKEEGFRMCSGPGCWRKKAGSEQQLGGCSVNPSAPVTPPASSGEEEPDHPPRPLGAAAMLLREESTEVRLSPFVLGWTMWI